MARRAEPVLPSDDKLLHAEQAAEVVGVSVDRWWAYYKRYPALLRGRRLVVVEEGTAGSYRWLRSACIEHIHLELPTFKAKRIEQQLAQGQAVTA